MFANQGYNLKNIFTAWEFRDIPKAGFGPTNVQTAIGGLYEQVDENASHGS